MEPGSTPNHGSRMGPRKGLMAALGTRTAPAHGHAKCHAGAGLWSFIASMVLRKWQADGVVF
jgi:hypothetical protein